MILDVLFFIVQIHDLSSWHDITKLRSRFLFPHQVTLLQWIMLITDVSIMWNLWFSVDLHHSCSVSPNLHKTCPTFRKCLFRWYSLFKDSLGGGNSYIFYFHPYLGKRSNLTNIFQMGWNHRLENICFTEPCDASCDVAVKQSPSALDIKVPQSVKCLALSGLGTQNRSCKPHLGPVVAMIPSFWSISIFIMAHLSRTYTLENEHGTPKIEVWLIWSSFEIWWFVY